MSQRPCIEVEILPWLSFVPPKDMTDRELEDATCFNREGVGSAILFLYGPDPDESLRTTLNKEMGQLAGFLDGKGYDVKFLGW